ncbi:MAG: CoA transferase, partial [Dehalococcoidia bacterium]|nr:CoA transferase [Dehalococcoidia bacterium]
MRSILEGIRVVDWTVFQVGPYASAMLADLGADVIHLEPRGRGDLLRGLNPTLGVDVVVQGRQINFEEHNRNKRSLALDLTRPESQEVVQRLVRKSDVLVTNYRTDAINKLGMDYKTLSQHNPKLIYASATGFGTKGPEKDRPGLDILAQAKSGAMMAAGEPGAPPTYPVPNVGDRATSFMLSYGVVAALLGRERFGIGQELSVSQLGTMIVLQGFSLMWDLMLGKSYPRKGKSKPENPLYNLYKCQDDRWIILCSLNRPGEWGTFCKAIGRDDLGADPRYATDAARRQYAVEISARLDEVFAGKPSAEWLQSFKEFDVFGSRIETLRDLPGDPQVLANDYIVEWDHPVWGKRQFPGFPVHFGETPATLRSPAPEVGQHNEEILMDICGYSWSDVDRLRE